MGESVQNLGLEDKLEQVFLAMQSGDFALAESLLPDIIENGSEVQKDMAESCQEQLKMLLEMEQQATEAMPEGLIAGEDEEEDAILGWDDDEDEEEIVVAEPDVPVKTPVMETPEVESEVEDMTEVVVESVDSSESEAEVVDEMFVATSEPEVLSENIFEKPFEQSDKKGLSDEREHEINLALEQATVLLGDAEYETAEDVLQIALDDGTLEQRRVAAILLDNIASKKAELVDTVVRTESEEIDVTEVKLEEDSETEVVEVEAELGDSVAVGVEIDITEVTLDDIEEADLLEEQQNVEEQLVEEQLVEEQLVEEQLVEEQLVEEQQNEETSVIVESVAESNGLYVKDNQGNQQSEFGEVFSDAEDTRDLLSPTDALFDFDFSSADVLPQTELSRSDVLRNTNSRQGFFVGGVRLMIDFASGTELIDMPSYFRVPNSPSWLVGLANMHGIVIPIFDLAGFLQLGNEEDNRGKRMMLAIQHDEKAVGIIIHGLPRRLAWSDEQKVDINTSPTRLREHIDAACLVDGELWFDLNSESLCDFIEKSL